MWILIVVFIATLDGSVSVGVGQIQPRAQCEEAAQRVRMSGMSYWPRVTAHPVCHRVAEGV